MIKGFASVLFAVLLASCATTPPTLHLQKGHFTLNGGKLSGATLRGMAEPLKTTQPSKPGWRLEVTNLDWFNNWPNGWTQATFDAGGTFELQSGKLTVKDPLILGDVRQATIRYFDTTLTGEEAQQALQHRWERIQAVAEFLHTQKLPPFSQVQDFCNTLRPLLFPELYGYLPGHQRGQHFVEGYGVFWDTDYTKAVFPPSLAEVRDSGTLWQDFRESPELWFFAYEMKSLATSLSKVKEQL